VVRLSRGAGLPEPLPDALGLALRLLGVGTPSGEQDLLLVSSAAARVARRLIVPARSYGETFYSSLLPFTASRSTVLIGARPRWVGSHLPTARLDEVPQAVTAGLSFELVAADKGGPWQSVGAVQLTVPLAAEQARSLRFNPFNRDGGLEPLGTLNALRRRAYTGSQVGRSASA
jgi:hypothetical protein